MNCFHQLNLPLLFFLLSFYIAMNAHSPSYSFDVIICFFSLPCYQSPNVSQKHFCFHLGIQKIFTVIEKKVQCLIELLVMF